MAREGAHVAVADRSAEGAAATVALIRNAGGSAEAPRLDVTDDVSLEAGIASVPPVTAGSISCTIMPARRWRVISSRWRSKASTGPGA
jgi:NAD(P)-dependent dehydrogenase (short-subunit alcohol dehydrogenase family)